MTHRLASAALGLAMTALIPFAAAAAQESAVDVIKKYYDVLHETMTSAEDLGFQGRFDKLRPAIDDTFNMTYVAQSTTGRHWKNFSEAEKETATEKVTDLSAATYAARFDKYSGEEFEVVDEKETGEGEKLVRTHIIDSKGQPVAINYLMRKNDDDAWRIVDVYLKGTYSEIATRRSEFTSVLRRQGLEGFVAAIDKKVAQLAEE